MDPETDFNKYEYKSGYSEFKCDFRREVLGLGGCMSCTGCQTSFRTEV